MSRIDDLFHGSKPVEIARFQGGASHPSLGATLEGTPGSRNIQLCRWSGDPPLPEGAFLTWQLLNREEVFNPTLALGAPGAPAPVTDVPPRVRVVTGTGGGALEFRFDADGGQFPMPPAGVQVYLEVGTRPARVAASVCAGSPGWFTRFTQYAEDGDIVIPPSWANTFWLYPGAALTLYPGLGPGEERGVTGPMEMAVDGRIVWSSI